MTLIKGFHHLSLKCRSQAEQEKVVDFYCRILGLPVAKKWENGIMFDMGNGLIEVFANGTDSPSQGAIRHFALAVESADECIARVRAEGYPVILEPRDVVIPSDPPYPARVAFCKGPLGEEIEFFQEKN